MKTNSTLRSDSLLIEVAVSLLKPILRILVWIARSREKTKPDVGQEHLSLPTYGQRFFRFLVFGDQLVALLDDQLEHYQKVVTKNEKDAADQWFYKELPETLALLILRSEPWVYAIHLIRRRASHLFSLRSLHNQLSSLLKILSPPAISSKLSKACVGLFVLIVTAGLLAPDSNQLPTIDVAEDRANESTARRDENPSSNRNEVSDFERSLPSPKVEQNESPVKPARADKPARVEPAVQVVTLKFLPITRSEASFQVVRVLPKRTKFYITMPWEIERGPYEIRITDASFKMLVSYQIRNVRNGGFVVVLDLRRFKPGRYWLTTSNDMFGSHACILDFKKQ